MGPADPDRSGHPTAATAGTLDSGEQAAEATGQAQGQADSAAGQADSAPAAMKHSRMPMCRATGLRSTPRTLAEPVTACCGCGPAGRDGDGPAPAGALSACPAVPSACPWVCPVASAACSPDSSVPAVAAAGWPDRSGSGRPITSPRPACLPAIARLWATLIGPWHPGDPPSPGAPRRTHASRLVRLHRAKPAAP